MTILLICIHPTELVYIGSGSGIWIWINNNGFYIIKGYLGEEKAGAKLPQQL